MVATGRIDASAAQIVQSVVFAWWRQRVEPRQDITLTVVSERSVREVSLDEDTDELSTVNVQSFVDEQEWRLYSNVETRVEVVTRVYQGDDCSEMMTMVYQGDDGLPRQRGSTRATMVYQGDDGLPGR